MKKGEMLSNAIVLATNAHQGQFDKGGSPYILHPLAVMNMVESEEEEIRCIAVLHDVIEDTKTTYEDLVRVGMSDRVIKGVMSMTKMLGETFEAYKKRVMSNEDAMRVKSADLRHNSDFRRLKGITSKDIERLGKYQVFYYEIRQKLEK